MAELGENPALDGIAIIGMSAHFPEADNIYEFWQNLINEKECISTVSVEEVRKAGIPESVIGLKNYVRRGGRIRNTDLFDAAFFGFSPKDAKLLDPQQRLFLKCGWEAIESAGYNVNGLDCSVGVFGGCNFNYYLLNNIISNPAILADYFELQTLFSSDKDYLATRLSYKFNLKGPSFTVQTACSTSLVAVHIACQNLLMYQCDMALAGGVGLQIPWWHGYIIGDADIRSKDGVCRPFDKNANGTLFGEGAGVVVLKRLEDAVNDGDHIYAVIKGTAINNDGSVKAGYTAPSVEGQIDVITAALETAGVSALDISYIEAHGTGTPLGDPVEISALTKAFRQYTQNNNYCGIGSVKASIGHLDAAAGIASLIKTVLSLHNKTLPASINFTEPNPLCEFDNSPFYVIKKTKPWEVTDGQKRRAGVSSLGVGGTNAHVILEEAPDLKKTSSSKMWHILPISAKSATALKDISQSYSEYFQNETDVELADSAFTMQQGRQHFPYRQFVIADSHSMGSKRFSSIGSSDSTKISLDTHSKIVFMFSGQGAQYSTMGRDLYKDNRAFRKTFDICSDILVKYNKTDLRQLLYNYNIEQETLLQQTEITQPLLLSFELSLAKAWEELGITPSAMIGHSIGEYTAACLAGVFTIEDILAIVAERGKIMASQPTGKMLSISLSPKEVSALLEPNLEIALINSPSLCVVAGEIESINQFQSKLEGKNIACRALHTSHAFHSKLMDGAVNPFCSYLEKYSLQSPSIPFISNTTGTWVKPTEVKDPHYWGQHIRNRVDFSSGLLQLLIDGYRTFIEVGPGSTLSSLLKSTLIEPNSPLVNSDDKVTVITSTRHSKSKTNDTAHLLTSFAALWQNGINVDWKKLYEDERRWRVPLPTYKFEEKRYWIDPAIRLNYGLGIPHESLPESQNIVSSQPTTQSDSISDNITPTTNTGEEENSDIKSELVSIWKSVLGVDDVNFETSFFELGGDSLLAVQMFSKIQKKTGINLQLATLFGSPTINALSSKILELLPKITKHPKMSLARNTLQKKTLSFVVPIKESGTNTPFFCVHSVGGNVLNYRNFLPYLDTEQPLYGIQCRGLDGIQKPFNSVKVMAQHYIDEIRQVQSHGPYRLGGGSMGGLIAFEIAQQLSQSGEKIELLLMLDSGCPYIVNKIIKKSPNDPHLQSVKKRSLLSQISHSISCRVSDFKKLTVCKWYQTQGKPIPHELRYWLIELKNLAIAESYIPKPYNAAITMFRAMQNKENHDPHRGWKDFAAGGITFFDFECDHANVIEDIEVAQKIGEVLKTM